MTSVHKTAIMRRLKGFMLKRMHRMITCKKFEEFIMAYLDDELPPGKKTIFEWHIRLCRECRDYLVAYRRSVELGRAVFTSPNDQVPGDVPEDLIRAILDAR